MPQDLRDDHIAIVGMACRLPGARTAGEYWENLAKGAESITWLTPDELAADGVPAREYRHPLYVNAAFLMEEMEDFDARFFGYTPREAEIRDPQGRWFLETCYAAVQDSGYDPAQLDGLVGVVGGMANNLYGERYVKRNSAASASAGTMAIDVSNNPDYLATTVSYRLGFRGPSVTVQTACSSSLVAVHTASQLLRNGECDYALAGGVEIDLPYRAGHVWVEGSIYTRDGHIRPFDADASGTIFSSGVGVVAMKRLSDAIADGDHVYAVLRGSAVNNDGGDRAGFTAPGVEGQAQLIVEALAVAEVHPDTIGLVEAHATGTLVGDPIELAGLSRAFRAAGATGVQSCPIGSVKANVGHLGPASGVAGLIKVCLALHNQTIPPSINFEQPNPSLELDRSPFYVVTELTPWPAGDVPRRAGVSSFGIGGTNVHVVVEEAPAIATTSPGGLMAPARRWQVLPVSARTAPAAENAARQVGAAIGALGDEAGTQGRAAAAQPRLADVAFTLQSGRAAHGHRRAIAADSLADAAVALAATGSPRQLKGEPGPARRLVMMFPGQGSQHAGMGRDLYCTEPAYRAALDECAQLLLPYLGLDIRELLMPADSGGDGADPEAQQRLRETRYSQPALFAVEYSMARLLAAAGLTPEAMIGHSIGEYVAACLAGVFSLPDALAIVAARGRLMQAMAPGSMLAIDGPAYVVNSMLPPDVEVASINGPRSTVVAGPADAVSRAAELFAAQQVACTELVTSHAFHTRLMEPCLAEFEHVVAGYPRRDPAVPFISNVTGTWITPSDATDPAYWARHLRSAVQFADGITELTSSGDVLLVEVGPGDVLSRLARQCAGRTAPPIVVTMRHPLRTIADDRVLAEALAAMWCHGAAVDWSAWTGTARRVPLPAYPFERQRYWVNPDQPADAAGTALPGELAAEDDWPLPADRCSFTPVWREAPLPLPSPVTGPAPLVSAAEDAGPAPLAGPLDRLGGSHVLLFDSGHPVLAALARTLEAAGARVTTARPGQEFAATAAGQYEVRPGSTEDIGQLLDALADDPLDEIVHGLTVTDPTADALGADAVGLGREHGFDNLLHLGQRLALERGDRDIRVHVLSSNMQEISSTERLEPAKALVLGPVMLIQREVAGVSARSIDIELPSALPPGSLARLLATDIAAEPDHAQVGWRGRKRWRLDYQMVPMEAPATSPAAGGVHLITGGLGALGLAVAEDIAASGAATIVLLGRSAVPERDGWDDLIAASTTPQAQRGRLTRLRAIEAAGSVVVPIQCDVSDLDSLAGAVASVRERYGAVRGVYHSAGVAGGAMMAVRSDADAAGVLAPKVDGTLNLYRLLSQEAEFTVLFSSLTAATGTFGQVDYCAANNFLDAFARWAGQRDQQVYSIGWSQWTDSGMSADSSDAAPRAFRELQTGARFTPAAHPLLDQRVHAPGDAITFCTTLEPGGHWVSSEHRLGDQDVVVGTSLLEMIDAAFTEGVGGRCEIRDVVFLGPIGVTTTTQIRIELSPDDAGYAVSITAGPAAAGESAADGTGAGWAQRLAGRVQPALAGTPPVHDLEAIRSRCARYSVSDAELHATGNLIDHGAHWARNVKSTTVGDREELSLVQIAEQYWPECGQYRLHPALLDTAVAEASYAEDRLSRGDSYLPFGYGRVRAHEPLPPRFWVHTRHQGAPGAEVDTMTVILMHDDGQEIARLDDYAERRVDPAAIAAAVAGGGGGLQVAARAVMPSAGPTIDEVSITPELGRDVLRRILAWRPVPHLLVCPEGIHRNLRRTQSLTFDVVQRELGAARLVGSAGSQERFVDTTFAEPETDLQRSLAELWGAALGVAQIGIDDVFFELGGNSLVAVQLASRVRETLSAELPIAILFDHPTIRSLAGFLEGRQAAGSTS